MPEELTKEFGRAQTLGFNLLAPEPGDDPRTVRVWATVGPADRFSLPICYLWLGDQIVLVEYEREPLVQDGEFQLRGVADFPKRVGHGSDFLCRDQRVDERVPLIDAKNG